MSDWARIYWQGFLFCLVLRVLIVAIGWKQTYRQVATEMGSNAWPLMGIGSFLWPLVFPFQIIELVLVISDRFDND